MKTRIAVLSLAIAVAFAGVASAEDATASAVMPATTAETAMPTTPAETAMPVTPPESTQAGNPMTETEVRALLATGGYSDINDVEFAEGTWTADAKSADGKHVEVRIDSATRKIIPDEVVATIGKDAIVIKVQEAGYSNVHDVEMEGGVWKAEADDSKGADVELKLDPNDGHILGAENDAVGDKH